MKSFEKIKRFAERHPTVYSAIASFVVSVIVNLLFVVIRLFLAVMQMF